MPYLTIASDASTTKALSHSFLTGGTGGESWERRRMHRSVNSPGYGYQNIISIGGDGELWRKFRPPPESVTRKTTIVSDEGGTEGTGIEHSNRGLLLSRQKTPTVTGWAAGEKYGAAPPLVGGKSKGFAGNPLVWDNLQRSKVKETEAKKFAVSEIERERTDRLMRAAGLM